MPVSVRLLRDDEGEMYLRIVNDAISGLAAPHYAPELIAGWLVPINEHRVRELMRNLEHEIRLVAACDGVAAGIGALVVERSELRACYVRPAFARRGCGSALVSAIERIAGERGLSRLEVAASLNAEPFYAAQGYRVRERSEVGLRNGTLRPAVWMEKEL